MKKIYKFFFKEEGFTLIETTIVLLVIAMLSLLILPNVSSVNENVTSSTNEAIITTVEAQRLLYEATEKEYTSDQDLVDNNYITPEQLAAYIEATSED